MALSHAAILEESMQARELLMQQNVQLDMARREAEMAICARNDFLAVMNHEMQAPMHAIIALSSLLQETELTPEQRSMVDIVLKSSDLLDTLINDVLDISRLEDGSLELDTNTFKLPQIFIDVISFSFWMRECNCHHYHQELLSFRSITFVCLSFPDSSLFDYCQWGDACR